MADSHVGVIAGVVSAITGVLALILAGMQYVHNETGEGPAPFTAVKDWWEENNPPPEPEVTPPDGLITIPPDDSEAPTAPQNLRIETQNGCSVTLRWDQSQDNVAVQTYRVYDGSQPIDGIEGQFTSAEVSMFPGETGTFAVLASDARNNESGLSNVVEVTPC